MTNIIPGKIQKNGPTITLSNFSGYSDRFMFCGDQFVSFRSAASSVSEAITGNIVSTNSNGKITSSSDFEEYKDQSGVFRIVNGSPTFSGWYSGEPVGSCNYVSVKYSTTVTTNVVKFWSKDYIDTSVIKIAKGYDSSYVSGISGASVSYSFDDTISLYSSESTPRGQYVYTISLGAYYSGRIWRIYLYPYSNIFTGTSITQVEVYEPTKAYLDYWLASGDEAGTEEIDVDYVYDVTYDNAEEVFYCVCYKEAGSRAIDPSDTFDTGTGGYLDSDLWDSGGNLFVRDTTSGTLVAQHPVAQVLPLSGDISTLSYTSGDFEAAVSAGFVAVSGYCSFYVADRSTNNVISSVNFQGLYGGPISLDSSYTGVSVYDLVDVSDATMVLSNLSIDPINVPSGVVSHKLYYNSNSFYYDRTIISGPGSNISGELIGDPGSFSHSTFSGTLSLSGTPESAAYIAFKTEKSEIKELPQEALAILQCNGNSITASFGGNILITSETDSTEYKFGFSGETLGETYIYFDGFTLSGTLGYLESPVFSVRALDYNGESVEATGVSNSAGVVIENLDLISDPEAKYGDYAGTVSIASDHYSPGNGGSLYIKIGQDIYKYNKSLLPISGWETGSSANVVSSGTIFSRNINSFGYDGYTYGGLSYIRGNTNLGYNFIHQMNTSTVSGTGTVAQLDVTTTAGGVFGRDFSDLNTLWYVDSSNQAYLFDIDDTHVAFCDLTTSEPAMQAGSGASAALTAYTVNLYGDPLSNKEITFAVTNGDGSVSPALYCSTSSGTAHAAFYVGNSEGNVTVTATASNDACS